MKPDLRMSIQELLHGFGLVRREVVQDDVDFASPVRGCHDFAQKVDKLRARVGARVCDSVWVLAATMEGGDSDVGKKRKVDRCYVFGAVRGGRVEHFWPGRARP